MTHRRDALLAVFTCGACGLVLLELGAASYQERKHGRGEAPPSLLPRTAAFSPDGKRVAIGFRQKGPYGGPLLRVWDVESREEVKYWAALTAPKKGKFHAVSFVAYLPGGKEILTVEEDSMCRIWKADQGKLVREFSVEEWGGFGGSLTADGRKLLTVVPGGFVVWDVAKGIAVKRGETAAGPEYFSISPHGERAILGFNRTGSTTDPTFSIYWDIEKHRAIQHLKVDRHDPKGEQERTVVLPVLFSPDGRSVLARKQKGCLDGLVLCDSADLKELKTLGEMKSTEDVRQGWRVAFSPDGTKLLLVTLGRKDLRHTTVEVRTLPKNEVLLHVPRPRELNESGPLAFSAANDMVLFVDELTLLDASTGKVLGLLAKPIIP